MGATGAMLRANQHYVDPLAQEANLRARMTPPGYVPTDAESISHAITSGAALNAPARVSHGGVGISPDGNAVGRLIDDNAELANALQVAGDIQPEGWFGKITRDLTRHTGNYHPINNPSGGIIRAIAENAGASDVAADRWERYGTAGAATLVGVPALLAAVQALNGGGGQVVVNNTSGGMAPGGY
jgi:hypothetical protein